MLGKSVKHSAAIHPIGRRLFIFRLDVGVYICDLKDIIYRTSWSKVVNYRAREIQIRVPFCPTHHTNMQRALDILKNPTFWGFVAAVVLINTFISPDNMKTFGGFLRVAVIVSLSAVIYVSTHVMLLLLHAFLFPDTRNAIYYPLIWIFLIVFVVVQFVVWMAPILDPYSVPHFGSWTEMYPVVLVRLIIFEWLFYCFFVTIIEKRGGTQETDTIMLGDHELKVLDILYIQAMEHRDCILTKSGEYVERSRFRDLMQILNDIDGIQPHRSYWIATHAILHLEGDEDRLNIVLVNGAQIAVARTRRVEVEEWARERTLLIRETT